VQDEFVSITLSQSYNFSVYIYPNRVPILNKAFADQVFIAGYALSFSFDSDAFIDEDGEVVSYTYDTGVDDLSGWLSYDPTTRTFSGTSNANNDAGVYTINIYADDTNINSDHGTISFTLTIQTNQPPGLDNGLTTPVNTTVYNEYSYIVPTDAFLDPEGEIFSFTVAVVPGDWSAVYNSADRSIKGTLSDNTKYGAYNFSFTLTDQFGISAVIDLPIYYNENQPPTILIAASDPSAIIAHYALNYPVPKSSYSDPELEILNFSFRVNDTVIGSWITMSQNTTHIHFEGTPNNLQLGDIILSIVIKDTHTDTGETVDNVTITVNENQIPYLSGTPVAPSSQIIGFFWSYNFDFGWIGEYEAELLIHS
jgi:hypothetical protein